MAGIQWTSSSIQSFFQTSLNQSTSGINSLYSLLGDKALIQSGSYHKLMDAYVKKVKSESSTSTTTTTTDEDTTKTTTSTTYDSTGTKTSSLTTDSIIDTLI